MGPFNFGNALLQGVQQGQNNRFRNEEQAFRQETQRALQDLQRQQFSEQVRQFDARQGQQAEQFNASLNQRDSQFNRSFGLDQQRTSLAQQAQDQLFGQFVDIAGPNGQSAQINIRDLLAHQRANKSLALQRRATDPFTINPEQINALSQLTSGENLQAPITLPFQLKGLASNAVGVAVDPIQQAQRQEVIRGIDTRNQVLSATDRASQANPIDPTQVARNIPFAERAKSFLFDGGSFIEKTAAALGREGLERSKQAGTQSEFDRVLSEQASIVQDINQLPVEARGAAAQQFATGSVRVLDDAMNQLDTSRLPEEEKRRIRQSLLELASYHLGNVPQADPVQQSLQQLMQTAVEEGDLSGGASVARALGSLRGQ